MTCLVTGSAGFIGFHLCKRLLKDGNQVIGVDNLNDYYDPSLKKSRLKILLESEKFVFYKADIADYKQIDKIFKDNKIGKVCNLAAQAGVRYSLKHPFVYEETNMKGLLNLLEAMRNHDVKDLVFASSSSVYGGITDTPYSEDMKIDKPISLYAATKAANELYAHVYHHLYDINAVGLRFFTAYGPWGRPDMAYFLFTKAILNDQPIKVFNHGKMKRDFTYIDDIISGVISGLDKVSDLEYEIINLGSSQTTDLMTFIETIENELGKEAEKEFLPLQPGDVLVTDADVTKAQDLLGYNPQTELEEGIKQFIDWYKDYYQE